MKSQRKERPICPRPPGQNVRPIIVSPSPASGLCVLNRSSSATHYLLVPAPPLPPAPSPCKEETIIPTVLLSAKKKLPPIKPKEEKPKSPSEPEFIWSKEKRNHVSNRFRSDRTTMFLETLVEPQIMSYLQGGHFKKTYFIEVYKRLREKQFPLEVVSEEEGGAKAWQKWRNLKHEFLTKTSKILQRQSKGDRGVLKYPHYNYILMKNVMNVLEKIRIRDEDNGRTKLRTTGLEIKLSNSKTLVLSSLVDVKNKDCAKTVVQNEDNRKTDIVQKEDFTKNAIQNEDSEENVIQNENLANSVDSVNLNIKTEECEELELNDDFYIQNESDCDLSETDIDQEYNEQILQELERDMTVEEEENMTVEEEKIKCDMNTDAKSECGMRMKEECETSMNDDEIEFGMSVEENEKLDCEMRLNEDLIMNVTKDHEYMQSRMSSQRSKKLTAFNLEGRKLPVLAPKPVGQTIYPRFTSQLKSFVYFPVQKDMDREMISSSAAQVTTITGETKVTTSGTEGTTSEPKLTKATTGGNKVTVGKPNDTTAESNVTPSPVCCAHTHALVANMNAMAEKMNESMKEFIDVQKSFLEEQKEERKKTNELLQQLMKMVANK